VLRSISVTIALVLVLASVLAGCTPVPEDAETEEATVDSEAAPVVVEPSEPVGSTDFTYLPGTWSVSATLDEIDKGAMREAADQPSQRWEIALDGTVMTLVTDTHTYVGTIEPELDSGWVFTAVTSRERSRSTASEPATARSQGAWRPPSCRAALTSTRLAGRSRAAGP